MSLSANQKNEKKSLLSYLCSFFKTTKNQKFGMLKGVFLPNILQMIGVILFMRLSWILGHVGIVEMTIIISMSSILLLITSLSMTSIVSNMKVGSGGSYFIISRLLGVEFGSAIGILIVISQHASIALCSTGFGLSLQEYLPHVPLNLIKFVTIFSLASISYISTEFALRTQMFIFVCLSISIASIFGGSITNIPATIEPENLIMPLSFWIAFAMYFPATTGIEAGMSMSGDLKNPSKSLAIGTILSVIVAFILYSSMAYFLQKQVTPIILKSYPFIVFYIAKFGFLVMIGIWGATLSSAMGSILGAPRILQSIAKDGILPKFLAKGYGPTNQPRIATLLVFITSSILAVSVNINQIIPVLTMACLVSYGLINFVAFFEQFIQNPSWRPTFKVPWFISMIGFLGCFMAMFMINPGATFIVIALTILLCFWTSSRNVQGNWDDLRYGLFSFLIHKGVTKLTVLEKNPKSWRPHILAIFDSAEIKKNMAYFAHSLNQEKGFLTFGFCIPFYKENIKTIDESSFAYKNILNSYKIPAYLHINPTVDILQGITQLIHNYGLGPLKPNTILLLLNKDLYKEDSFCNLLINNNFLQKNVILLKDSDSSVFTEATKKEKQINLWWRSDIKGNFELCLALALIMQNDKIWSGAKICIKAVVENEEKRQQLINVFIRFNQKMRIKNISFIPLVDPTKDFISNLLKFSTDADLTFITLKKYSSEESFHDYKNYYLNLFANTESMKNLGYVLPGESLQFEKIFTQ